MITRRKLLVQLTAAALATPIFARSSLGLDTIFSLPPASTAKTKALDAYIADIMNKPEIFEATICVLDKNHEHFFHSSGGTHSGKDVTIDTPYLLASASKLFATTLILQLVDQNRIDLDASATSYLPKNYLDGIHIFRGTDYSNQITIRQLLAQTSGLPDYFEGERDGEPPLSEHLFANKDRHWTIDDTVRTARDLQHPHFAPDTPGKAFYSDTNFQLLVPIIESLFDDKIADIIDRQISKPLGLQNTYLFKADNPAQPTPLPLRDGDNVLDIPQAIESTRLDGAIVSTARDSLKLIHAFWEGHLFDKSHLMPPHKFNDIFFPLQYGMGFMRFELPWIFSPFTDRPVFLGHSGISGAFMFFCPEQNMYFAGTVNQLSTRQLPFQMMINAMDI